MVGKLKSADVVGIDPIGVIVEVTVQAGLPDVVIVGLPDKAVKESRDRVKSAIIQSGFDWPARGGRRLVVNLAPAGVAKRGAVFDLPIALGALIVSGQLPSEAADGYFAIGELALDGAARPATGVLSAAMLAAEEKARGILVPRGNEQEAAVACPDGAYGVPDLATAVAFLQGRQPLEPAHVDVRKMLAAGHETLEDFADVRGQEHAKRALAVAAAGAHNVLMVGPPGAGKSMLARRLPSILPALSFEEAVEATRIHSAAGALAAGIGLLPRRPFRSPHHTVSDAGLVGGGAVAMPGEISLAHNGVLFLDEFPEFDRRLREAMRQPMEDGAITVSRAAYTVTFPARFMLVAAMNPCPCGYYGDSRRRCRCTSTQIEKYLSRLSGPLLDRVDIHVEVPAVEHDELRSRRSGTGSAALSELVIRARRQQEARFEGRRHRFNAHMSQPELERHCRLDAAPEQLLRRALNELGLSARGTVRVLKVARTIADMAGHAEIASEDIAEAIQYRLLDRLGLW